MSDWNGSLTLTFNFAEVSKYSPWKAKNEYKFCWHVLTIKLFCNCLSHFAFYLSFLFQVVLVTHNSHLESNPVKQIFTPHKNASFQNSTLIQALQIVKSGVISYWLGSCAVGNLMNEIRYPLERVFTRQIVSRRGEKKRVAFFCWRKIATFWLY
jgi:hypothetical protein